MKKILSLVAAVVAVSALASCDSKLCYCYDHTSNGTVYEQEVYTGNDTPCSSLSNGDRGCVETYERMDPGTLAVNPTL